jgi:hypothetical protein
VKSALNFTVLSQKFLSKKTIIINNYFYYYDIALRGLINSPWNVCPLYFGTYVFKSNLEHFWQMSRWSPVYVPEIETGRHVKNNGCTVEIKIKWMIRKHMTYESTYHDDITTDKTHIDRRHQSSIQGCGSLQALYLSRLLLKTWVTKIVNLPTEPYFL